MIEVLLIRRKTRTLVRVFLAGKELPGGNVMDDTGISGTVGKTNILATSISEQAIKTRLELAYPEYTLI